jgi:tRNA(His) guanylyltransferase
VTRHDPLGDRMKDYERRARTSLPRRTYTIVRLDGKSFHTYTRDLERPWDRQLAEDMTTSALFLCRSVANVRLAYLQSDEVSLLLTDFDTPRRQAWFDGQVQKLVSVTASMFTARFNELRPGRLAFFDSRAFTIADPADVERYLIWRQLDATRNSVTSAARCYVSHRQVQGRSTNELQELLWSLHGVNWNDYDPRFKRGTMVTSRLEVGDVTYVDRRSGEQLVAPNVERRVWSAKPAPILTRDPLFLASVVPPYVPPVEEPRKED